MRHPIIIDAAFQGNAPLADAAAWLTVEQMAARLAVEPGVVRALVQRRVLRATNRWTREGGWLVEQMFVREP